MSTFELCETVRPLLSAVVDGEAAPTEVVLVEEHVRACRACASHLAFLRLSHGVLARTPDVFPPSDLASRIAAATYARPTLAQRLFGFLRPAPARYALATALTVGIVAVVVSRLPQPVTAPPDLADAARPEAPVAPGSGDAAPPTSPARRDSAPTVASAPATASVPVPAAAAATRPAAPRTVAAAAKPAGPRADARPVAGSAANPAIRRPDASATVAAAPVRATRRAPGGGAPFAASIQAAEPKVTAPSVGGAPDGGSAAPLVADGAATPRVTVPTPRSSPLPSLPEAGRAPTLAASTAASVPTAASAARTPVSEEKRPTAIAHLDEEGEGGGNLKLTLKNVQRVADLGEVALGARGAKGRGAGLNSSFGVADGRGAAIPIVDTK